MLIAKIAIVRLSWAPLQYCSYVVFYSQTGCIWQDVRLVIANLQCLVHRSVPNVIAQCKCLCARTQWRLGTDLSV